MTDRLTNHVHCARCGRPVAVGPEHYGFAMAMNDDNDALVRARCDVCIADESIPTREVDDDR